MDEFTYNLLLAGIHRTKSTAALAKSMAIYYKNANMFFQRKKGKREYVPQSDLSSMITELYNHKLAIAAKLRYMELEGDINKLPLYSRRNMAFTVHLRVSLEEAVTWIAAKQGVTI